MIIHDRLYGDFTITESVLQELLTAPSVLRLQRIAQHGIATGRYTTENEFSRYEHSVGVMLLLRRLGASLNEQVAGLLHDVSHTAFSHVIDWVIGDSTKEDYQDNRHREVILNSELPAILQHYNIDPEDIIEYHPHTLLEQPIPALCADRVDYALREFQDWANPTAVESILASLVAHNGRIVFTDEVAARIFAETFLHCQREHWASAEARARYNLFAEAIRLTLQHRTVLLADFSLDDQQVMAKLQADTHPRVQEILALLAGPIDPATLATGLNQAKKLRYVDPPILKDGKIVLLQALDPNYQEQIKDYQQELAGQSTG